MLPCSGFQINTKGIQSLHGDLSKYEMCQPELAGYSISIFSPLTSAGYFKASLRIS